MNPSKMKVDQLIDHCLLMMISENKSILELDFTRGDNVIKFELKLLEANGEIVNAGVDDE